MSEHVALSAKPFKDLRLGRLKVAMKPCGFGLTVGILIAFAAVPAKADDGFYSEANSEYIYGSPVKVQMVRERVQIFINTRKIDGTFSSDQVTCVCDFVFHNSGPAETVTIAFPESGDTTSEADADHPSHPQMLLDGFRSFVNGRQVPVKAVWSEKNGAYNHLKTVHFQHGQTLRVRDVFTECFSEQDAGDTLVLVPYILGTGGTWAKNLRRAEIDLIEMPGPRPLHVMAFPTNFAKKYSEYSPDRQDTLLTFLGDHRFGTPNNVWVDWPHARIHAYGNIIKCVRTNFKPTNGETCKFYIAAIHDENK